MKKYILNLSIIIFISINIKANNDFSSEDLHYDINQKLYHSHPAAFPFRKKEKFKFKKESEIEKIKILHPIKKKPTNQIIKEIPVKNHILKTQAVPKNQKLIENTDFWFYTNSPKRIKTLKTKKSEIFNPNFNPNLMISFTLYFFFTLTSFYSIFFSYKSKRIFFAILSYTNSYYFILFITTSINFSEKFQVLVQIFIFLFTIFFGFFFIIFTYKTNFFKFIIFGFAIASGISVFIAQFFIDFASNEDLVMFFSIYFLLTVTFCIVCFFYYEDILIFFSALLHSCVFVFNFSLIFGKIVSFEHRQVFEKDGVFGIYVIIISFVTIFGFFSQYFMKKKRNIMKEMQFNFDDDVNY